MREKGRNSQSSPIAASVPGQPGAAWRVSLCMDAKASSLWLCGYPCFHPRNPRNTPGIPDLPAGCEDGIWTVKRCPASDTGAPTLADTDTVWAEGVPAFNTKQIKINPETLPELPPKWNLLLSTGTQRYKESDFQAELHILPHLQNSRL